jgi:hypothetical protein
MPYESARILAYQSYQRWINNELFSFSWFFEIAIILIFYAIWLRSVDKSRIQSLLLLGSLSAVGFAIADIVLMGYFGVAEYKIRLFPIEPALFIVSITIAPTLYMLVLQYTSSWKDYLLWAGIGTTFLSFVLLPIYSLLGIIQLYHWSYFYQFILMLTNGVIARVLLLWFIRIEQSTPASSRKYQVFPGLLPVFTKHLENDKEDRTDNDE